jgi:hypothetical protein
MRHEKDENDWSARVIELERFGLSLTLIGESVGLSIQGISDLKHGRRREPRGMVAVRLWNLHRRTLCRRRRGSAAADDATQAAA